jgi:hypothetical protein
MKNIQEQQQNLKRSRPSEFHQNGKNAIVNADFKVID